MGSTEEFEVILMFGPRAGDADVAGELVPTE